MIKIAFVFGTRPEAIKLAPVINRVQKDKKIKPYIISSGQHREILDPFLDLFAMNPDFDLKVMKKNQDLASLTAKIIKDLYPILGKLKPDVVMVQGDTTTAMTGSLVAFYHQIKVAHLEAGLRSFNKSQPFPEEINRRLISTVADIHFTPTKKAKENLVAEGVDKKIIYNVGNTVIDALNLILKTNKQFQDENLKKINLGLKTILVTTHRRENLGRPMQNISQAINVITKTEPMAQFIIPMHPNPKVREILRSNLAKNKNVFLIEPLNYPDFVLLMKKSYLILTDSGGVQEEAPTLGKPVLVMRETTERSEGIEAGTAILVGTDKKKIVNNTLSLLKNKKRYHSIAHKKNPYGDGKSSQKIVKIIKNYFQK